MRKIIALLALAILVSGCATFGQMEKGLNALQGSNVQTAFDVLGYPSSKQEFGKDTVYYWKVANSGTMLLPETSTTTGYVGMTPVYGTTTYNQAVPVSYNCLIKIITDDRGTIKTWEYNGNYGGCGCYIDRLNKYYNQQNPKTAKNIKGFYWEDNSKRKELEKNARKNPDFTAWNKLEVGMEFWKVKLIIGDEWIGTKTDGNKVYWYYPCNGTVTFIQADNNSYMKLESWVKPDCSKQGH